jgi:hypothetical protein
LKYQIKTIVKDRIPKTRVATGRFQMLGCGAAGGDGDDSRLEPQCLHLIAAARISSAQYGHRFVGSIPIPFRSLVASEEVPTTLHRMLLEEVGKAAYRLVWSEECHRHLLGPARPASESLHDIDHWVIIAEYAPQPRQANSCAT